MVKMTIEDIRAMKPERPQELDKLNAFVGRWEWSGEATIGGLDRPLKFTGRNEARWEGDGWYLVSHEVGNMEELGETQGMAAWAYDARNKKFRTTWVDTMGTTGASTAWHDEKTDTWYMRTTGYGPFGKTSAKGIVKFADPNTMVWHWTEYAKGGLIKAMELTGTSKRQ
jgi:hypothetical protein